MTLKGESVNWTLSSSRRGTALDLESLPQKRLATSIEVASEKGHGPRVVK
jgi:hypothetical protein